MSSITYDIGDPTGLESWYEQVIRTGLITSGTAGGLITSEKCVIHRPTTQSCPVISCYRTRCSSSHHVAQETCTEGRKLSISWPRHLRGFQTTPSSQASRKSCVNRLTNLRTRTSPTRLPSPMADGCTILKWYNHVIWLGEASWRSNALHPLKTLNFFVAGVVKISTVSQILLCACRYYNNFLFSTLLFMRKQLFMWLRMVFSRYENHWNTFL